MGKWIKQDWTANRIRFCLEILAWIMSITCSVVMAGTSPNPPLTMLYPMWVISSGIYAYCAVSRKSLGMSANYALLTLIDLIGLYRTFN